MRAFFVAIFRLFKYFFLIVFFSILLLSGMAAGGFFLLDHLIRGETVKVPRLYGLPKTEAIEILIENELIPNFKEVPRDDLEPGMVIEQHPLPGSEVKKHRSITLVISVWAGKIDVPNLIRQREDEIVAELRASNLEVGLQAEMHHPQYPKGAIIAQFPIPGLRYVKNRQIDLLISLGPELQSYVMPNYEKQNYHQVVSKLKNTPFTFSKDDIEFRQTPDVEEWNKVLKQIPAPGTYTKEGENVKLVVGSSGQISSKYRIEYVEFPMPFVLYPERLSLIVWDETARTFQHPHIFPIRQYNLLQNIELYIPVAGDALIALGVPELKHGIVLPNFLIKSDYVVSLPNPQSN